MIVELTVVIVELTVVYVMIVELTVVYVMIIELTVVYVMFVELTVVYVMIVELTVVYTMTVELTVLYVMIVELTVVYVTARTFETQIAAKEQLDLCRQTTDETLHYLKYWPGIDEDGHMYQSPYLFNAVLDHHRTLVKVCRGLLETRYTVMRFCCCFLKVLGGHMSFFGATGTPVLDFWVSKPEKVLRYSLFCGGECNVHSPRTISGPTHADFLAAGIAAGHFPTYINIREIWVDVKNINW